MHISFNKKYLCLSLVLWLCCQCLVSQTKDEKETRVRLEDFPESAQRHFDSLPDKVKRIRFYKETDGDKESFESKFKYKNHWHSVEFDSSGQLEDIEVTVKKKEIPKSIVERIEQYLNNHSDKFELIKIQEQYIYDSDNSESRFIHQVLINRNHHSSNYEIIVDLKSEKTWILSEITFDSTGQFLNTRNLQPDSYEYIMY